MADRDLSPPRYISRRLTLLLCLSLLMTAAVAAVTLTRRATSPVAGRAPAAVVVQAPSAPHADPSVPDAAKVFAGRQVVDRPTPEAF